MTSNSIEPDQIDEVKIHNWDHMASSYTCDPNYDSEEAVTSLSAFKGRNSIFYR